MGDGIDGRKVGRDPSRTLTVRHGETHQLVIGGVGVVVGVRLGDAHGHAVGEYGEENENIKGLEGSVKGCNGPENPPITCGEGLQTQRKGYFHSTRASAAMRMGLLRVRQQRARGARRADLLACIAFLAPPPLFLAEPVDPRVSDLPTSPTGGASGKHQTSTV